MSVQLSPRAAQLLATITTDAILEAYSGKVGCMCGCKGRYFVNPIHKAACDARRGYEQPASKIGAITRCLNTLRTIAGQWPLRTDLNWSEDLDGTTKYIAVESREFDRSITIYLA